jgi:hypothetical protein
MSLVKLSIKLFPDIQPAQTNTNDPHKHKIYTLHTIIPPLKQHQTTSITITMTFISNHHPNLSCPVLNAPLN